MRGPDFIALFAAPLDAAGIAYMVTGATAAIYYGQPRTTNDIDVVLELRSTDLPQLRRVFPESDFYLPPDEVIEVEIARASGAHLNVLHLESGFKADLYPIGQDPLHHWAFPRKQRVEYAGLSIPFAPPEYVIVRKLSYYRDGNSGKHLSDIRAMFEASPAQIDKAEIERWVQRLGLQREWALVGTQR